MLSHLPGGWQKTVRAHGKESSSRCTAGQRKHVFQIGMPQPSPIKPFFYFFDSLAKVCYFSIWGGFPKEIREETGGENRVHRRKTHRRRKKSLAFHPADRVGSFDPEW